LQSSQQLLNGGIVGSMSNEAKCDTGRGSHFPEMVFQEFCQSGLNFLSGLCTYPGDGPAGSASDGAI